MLNGVCLWLLFLGVRVIGIPVWLAAYASDVRAGALSPAAGAAPATLALTPLRVLAPAVQLMLWVISCFWFSKLTAGMIKAVRGGGGRDEKEV